MAKQSQTINVINGRVCPHCGEKYFAAFPTWHSIYEPIPHPSPASCAEHLSSLLHESRGEVRELRQDMKDLKDELADLKHSIQYHYNHEH